VREHAAATATLRAPGVTRAVYGDSEKVKDKPPPCLFPTENQ